MRRDIINEATQYEHRVLYIILMTRKSSYMYGSPLGALRVCGFGICLVDGGFQARLEIFWKDILVALGRLKQDYGSSVIYLIQSDKTTCISFIDKANIIEN